MGIDEIITLDDQNEYLLLLDITYDNEVYFLATKMVNKNPSEEFEILLEENSDGEIYVKTIEDSELISKLMHLFDEKFDMLQE